MMPQTPMDIGNVGVVASCGRPRFASPAPARRPGGLAAAVGRVSVAAADGRRAGRLRAMSDDAKTLIEQAAHRFLDEVPALKPMKLVVGIALRGRGDVQMFRLQMPEVEVTKDIASDAKVRVEMPRAFFNELAKDGRVADWREAFTYGQAKATGPSQILQLIDRVVEKQEERGRQRRARH
jgi:hypothetical protein